MFRRKAQTERESFHPSPPGAGQIPAQNGLHKVGETTAMFRWRTAESIHVELEEEIDAARWPELLRRYLG